jgi:transglutaminase-like putative cysteine protease
MAEFPASSPLPIPESDDLGRYLEDTITIDWQTPAVSNLARHLLADSASPAAGIERIFRFVRDEITHTFDLDPATGGAADAEARSASRAADGVDPKFLSRGISCRASEVLALRHGLCHAKSHLLAALLRFAGHPTGFCYVRLVDDERPGRFVLHGFNAFYWAPTRSWIPVDARGNRGGIESDCRFEAPFSLAYVPDAERGETFLPWILKRPGKRVIDALERAPSIEALRRNLPDGP